MQRVGVAGEERPDDRREEHIGGRHRAELRPVGQRHAERGDHDRELTPGDERSPCPGLTSTARAHRASGRPPRDQLPGDGDHQQCDRWPERAGQLLGIDLEREEEEEDRGEQVAKRLHQSADSLLHRPREGEPDEERTDRCRDLQRLGEGHRRGG